jgi:hypothetical protein
MRGLVAAFLGGSTSGANRSLIEGLEPRRLMSAGPVLINEQLIGPGGETSGIVLTFDKPLDPTSAQNVNGYSIFRRKEKKDDGNALLGAFVPFAGDDGSTSTTTEKLKIDSATYDPATFSVTLTPHRTFGALSLFRQLRVAGHGINAVTGIDGVALDGNGDGKVGDHALVKFSDHRNKKLSLKEKDGDRVTFRLTGGGNIASLIRSKTGPAPLLYIVNAVPGQSVMTATIKKGRHGDGVIDIQELTGISTADVTFLNDPAFTIEMTQP